MTTSLKKRIIAGILIPVLALNIILFNVKETKGAAIPVGAVLAVGVPILVDVIRDIETSPTYQQFYENVWQPNFNNFLKESFRAVGLPSNWDRVADFISTTYGPDPLQNLRIWMANRSGESAENITDDEVKEKVYQMIDNSTVNSNNDTVTISNDLRDYILFLTDAYQQNNKMYTGYSLDLQYYSIDDYTKNYISEKQRNYYVFGMNGLNHSNVRGYSVVLVPKANTSFVLNVNSDLTDNSLVYGIDKYNTTTFNAINSGEFHFIKDNTVYDNLNGAVQNNFGNGGQYCMKKSYPYRATDYDPGWNGNWTVGQGYHLVTVGYVESIAIYGTFGLFTSSQRGESPYYVDNSSYQDFSQSSGDYTFGSNNTNYTTYEDITNYNDSFNTENGYYPSPTDVSDFINNNNININNGSGGGNGGGSSGSGSVSVVNNNNPVINNNIHIGFDIPSMSGNSVSGNGSGESGGIGSIFGFLSQIGHVIGDLIKNIGQVLADILEGIASVVSDLLESIPTVFGDFMGALIGWLPPELQALITLSITAMIIVGLIKLFRG